MHSQPLPYGRTLILAVFFIGIFHSLSAENFVIIEEIYRISGRTNPAVLSQTLGNPKGTRFENKADLEEFARVRAQKIENLRSFKKSEVGISYPDILPDAEAPIPVTLTVTIEDGTPISPIPYAFYNSNDGVQMGLLLSMPNLAGSLQDLMFVGLYEAPPDDDDKLQWTNPNFLLLGAWSGIKIDSFKLAFSGNIMKKNHEVVNRGTTGVTYSDLRILGNAALGRPLTENITNTLSFKLGGSPESSVEQVIDPALLSYGPILMLGKIQDELEWTDFDWKGNLRDGYRAKATASYTQTKLRKESMTYDFVAEAEFAGYYTLGDRFNPSFRIYSFVNTGLPLLDIGYYARGIRNTGMKGNFGVFLNTGLQTKIFRLGTAEVHLTPTIDLGWAYVRTDPAYRDDFGVGVGGELILISDSMKNLPFKLGVAYDLRPDSRIGDGKRLEIDFNFSLPY